jgi:hypothetical protein
MNTAAVLVTALLFGGTTLFSFALAHIVALGVVLAGMYEG